MTGDGEVHPEVARWVARHHGRPGTAAAEAVAPLEPGTVLRPVALDAEALRTLAVAAAKAAAGFFRPTSRSEVLWVEGDSQLAVGIAGVTMAAGEGTVEVRVPVRCDQVGEGLVRVAFAVGRPDRPAGLYAATARRPDGPPAVVDAWGEALVAFAWQVLLGLATQVAGACGKDARGNVLVPADLAATDDGLTVLPMARYRFAGSSGLRQARP